MLMEKMRFGCEVGRPGVGKLPIERSRGWQQGRNQAQHANPDVVTRLEAWHAISDVRAYLAALMIWGKLLP